MLMAIYKLLRGDNSTMELVGRNRARQAFLRMNDRLLADAGISREKLNQGLEAWPWHVERPDELVSAPTRIDADSMRAGETVASHESDARQETVSVDDIAIVTAFDKREVESRHAA